LKNIKYRMQQQMCINKRFEKHMENHMFFSSVIDAHVLLYFIFNVFQTPE